MGNPHGLLIVAGPDSGRRGGGRQGRAREDLWTHPEPPLRDPAPQPRRFRRFPPRITAACGVCARPSPQSLCWNRFFGLNNFPAPSSASGQRKPERRRAQRRLRAAETR